MKKKLEADLISIAHRVLQMKNKSDINQLCIETRKLYEKLAILQFVEEHFEGVKPTIGQAEIVEKMKHFFEEIHISDPLIHPVKKEILAEETVIDEVVEEEIVVQHEVVAEKEIVAKEVEIDEIEEEIVAEEVAILEIEEKIEEVVEVVEKVEEIKVTPPEFNSNDIGFKPAFELDHEIEEKAVEEVTNKTKETQISFLDLLGGDYSEPMFVKVDKTETKPAAIAFEIDKESVEETIVEEKSQPKSVSLNEKLSKGINVGLNDRIAFVKHLFGNSDEDYTRVMNQIITYDSFDEAQGFIEDMVKPDYNSWEGKEDYAQRFIEIIEKKFA